MVSNSPVKFCVKILHSWAICVLKQKQNIHPHRSITQERNAQKQKMVSMSVKDAVAFSQLEFLPRETGKTRFNWKNKISFQNHYGAGWSNKHGREELNPEKETEGWVANNFAPGGPADHWAPRRSHEWRHPYPKQLSPCRQSHSCLVAHRTLENWMATCLCIHRSVPPDYKPKRVTEESVFSLLYSSPVLARSRHLGAVGLSLVEIACVFWLDT